MMAVPVDYLLELHGESLILLPERALYWPRTETLFIADLHLGKAATFRAYGIPLPEGTSTADLDRLTRALTRTSAARLIILGDLLHSAKGRESVVLDEFTAWRTGWSALTVDLIVGNHDRRAGKLPPEWDLTIRQGPCIMSPFVLNHEPMPLTDNDVPGYVLCGHLHPQIQLIESGKQKLKVPCFWFGEHGAVLPAFSTFSSGVLIAPLPDDQIFLITDSAVIRYR